jgi:hypothetical protein
MRTAVYTERRDVRTAVYTERMDVQATESITLLQRRRQNWSHRGGLMVNDTKRGTRADHRAWQATAAACAQGRREIHATQGCAGWHPGGCRQ